MTTDQALKSKLGDLYDPLAFIVSRGGLFTASDFKLITGIADAKLKLTLDDLTLRKLIARRFLRGLHYYQTTRSCAKLAEGGEYAAQHSSDFNRLAKGLSRLRLGIEHRGYLCDSSTVQSFLHSKNILIKDRRISIDLVSEEGLNTLYVYAPVNDIQLNNVLLNTLTALDFATERITVCFYTHASNTQAVRQVLASFVDGFEAGPAELTLTQPQLSFSKRAIDYLFKVLSGESSRDETESIKSPNKYHFYARILPVLGIEI